MPNGKLKLAPRVALAVFRGALIVGLVLSTAVGFERLAGAIAEPGEVMGRAISLLIGVALIVVSYWFWGNIVQVLKHRHFELRPWPTEGLTLIPTRTREWLRFIFAGLLLLPGGLLILVVLADAVPYLIQFFCLLFGVVAFDLGLMVLAPLYGVGRCPNEVSA